MMSSPRPVVTTHTDCLFDTCEDCVRREQELTIQNTAMRTCVFVLVTSAKLLTQEPGVEEVIQTLHHRRPIPIEVLKNPKKN